MNTQKQLLKDNVWENLNGMEEKTDGIFEKI